MARIIISPSKYVQGAGELDHLCEHASALGKQPLILITKGGFERFGMRLSKGFASTPKIELFGGECSEKEIERLRRAFCQGGCDYVVGVGGGKTLDTAKAVAYYEKAPVAIVPTIASTDAPCSALAVIYTEDSVFERYLFFPKNPDLVLVDTGVICRAPARLFAAGMGDALATYFEAKATLDARGTNMAHGKSTKAALALARLCYDTLLEDGLKALLAVKEQVCTEAVENVVEANTYLSGLGFESGGLAAAHAIHNGFTVLSCCHKLYHGEKVAFGTIVQLALQNAPTEEIEEVVSFCRTVGLPTTLLELGIEQMNPEEIMAVARASVAPGESIYNMPMEITADRVYAAILAADAIGRFYAE